MNDSEFQLLFQTPAGWPKPGGNVVRMLGQLRERDAARKERFDGNVIDRPTEIPLIVEWPDLGVAASHFVSGEEVGEILGDRTIANTLKTGRFRVRIRGTCMEPKWLDGDLIEFELLRDDIDFVEQEDYYIECNDGATFKRCIVQDEQIITIACLNAPKKQWQIPRRDIRRAAVARFALVIRE